MKKVISALILSLIIICGGCTAQQRAKQFGGTITIDLPPNQKLVVATWKDMDLWYLTRPMRKGEIPEKSIFTEDSSYGIFEGEVIFNETK
jgi:hypothetical protein